MKMFSTLYSEWSWWTEIHQSHTDQTRDTSTLSQVSVPLKARKKNASSVIRNAINIVKSWNKAPIFNTKFNTNTTQIDNVSAKITYQEEISSLKVSFPVTFWVFDRMFFLPVEAPLEKRIVSLRNIPIKDEQWLQALQHHLFSILISIWKCNRRNIRQRPFCHDFIGTICTRMWKKHKRQEAVYAWTNLSWLTYVRHDYSKCEPYNKDRLHWCISIISCKNSKFRGWG